LLSPGWEKARAELGDLAKSEEDILSYALFPQIARPFLERRAKGLCGKEELAAAIAAMLFKQVETKVNKDKAAIQTVAAGAPWKMAGRSMGLRRGGW
jgi:pyruvate/oxaloacetate carboxyltransferase